MDESIDGKSSRPPTLDDVVSLCRSLNSEGVKYVIIGGVAVNKMDVQLLRSRIEEEMK